MQFDPGVLTEGNKTYLYTGFCPIFVKDRFGAMSTVLGKDMITIEEEPKIIVPRVEYTLPEQTIIEKKGKITTGCPYKLCDIKNWEAYKDHAYFEAPSIRKIGDTYYFIYSSTKSNELCYATSKSPTHGFIYRGVIISNVDENITSYKPADMMINYTGNNHGGIEKINGEWYIFYHRHTNGTSYSRQGCAEKIKIEKDGSIPQTEITSCGLNGGPLLGKGEYPAYIACHLFTENFGTIQHDGILKITQDGRDGEDGNPIEGINNAEDTSYITGIKGNAVIGFKYFDFKGIKKVTIKTRAALLGNFEIRTKWDGEVLGKIQIKEVSNYWEEHSGDINIPDGVSSLYLKYIEIFPLGIGQLKSIKFE